MTATLPIHLVTGFLGAGKTTLINRLLRALELSDTLVMVNEWGEVGLDHLLYERISGDAILLASGCLCCNLRGDLVDGLRDVLRRRDAGSLAGFARIVLETSGLADPAPILHALFADPELARRLRLAAVTTLVDAVNGPATLDEYGEARRQVALADRLLVSKAELSPDLAALRTALAAINPAAPIVDLASETFGARQFLAETPPRPARASPMAAHGGDVRARAFTTERLIEPAGFARFLDVLMAMLGPGLLRVKGLIGTRDAPERPWLVQGARHAFAPPRRLDAWPSARRETILVLIADGLDAEPVERLWRALTGAPAIDEPDLAAMTENPLAPRRGGLL